jgi:hypothetical protein
MTVYTSIKLREPYPHQTAWSACLQWASSDSRSQVRTQRNNFALSYGLWPYERYHNHSRWILFSKISNMLLNKEMATVSLRLFPPSIPLHNQADSGPFIEVRTQPVLVKTSSTESYMITPPLSSYLRRRGMAGLKSTLRIGRQWARYWRLRMLRGWVRRWAGCFWIRDTRNTLKVGLLRMPPGPAKLVSSLHVTLDYRNPEENHSWLHSTLSLAIWSRFYC